MIHLLCDALLLLKQNALMQYSNNRNVFCCNNRSALFQYRPTLLHMQLWIYISMARATIQCIQATETKSLH